jgi:exosortase
VALVVSRRDALEVAAVRPWPLALAALALCIFAWLVCYRASIQDLHITIFPALFWLAAAAAFGWRVARLLIFPVAFFYFAVPSWSQLSNPLQDLTVLAMKAVLALTGPAAEIHGSRIHIPHGTFEVQEGCSGLHYLIVGLAVAALNGELRHDSLRNRFIQLAFMSALALLANWVRVYVIIEVGYLTDMHSALLRNHYWFGWGVFAVALVIFFYVTGKLIPESAAGESRPPSSSGPVRRDLAGIAAALVLLVALPALSVLLRSMHPPAALPDTLPANPPRSWQPVPVDVHSSWQPHFNGADQQRRLTLAEPGGSTVELYTVDYRSQRQGAELIGSGSTVLGATLWQRSAQLVTMPAGRFREYDVTERADPFGEYLIWSRYEIAGRVFVAPLAAQLWYGINATVSNPWAALLAFRAPCRPDCDAARRTLASMTEALNAR